MLKNKIFKGAMLYNLSEKDLVKRVVREKDAYVTLRGAVGIFTGKRTSRSPNDRYIVLDRNTRRRVSWGDYNQPIKRKVFKQILRDAVAELAEKKIYVMDCYAGMNEDDSLRLRVFTTKASQALFCEHMFKNVRHRDLKRFKPKYRVLASPDFELDPKKYGINSEAFIGIDMSRKIILVLGTGYTCEIKKAIFSIFNFQMPQKGVLCMHCSCNSLPGGSEAALFFGLSGTGKTTLSNTRGRNVVGDDQHGWNDKGIFNIENGCYAKVFELSKTHEPEIFEALRDGTMLENVPLGKNGQPDFNDASITENMRAVYPMWRLKNVELSGRCEHPKNIFFLTADSTGVFPPISKLTRQQAMYYFVNGFTSKMGGTENKIFKPEFTFSSCFGAPFLPLPPSVYSNLLGERITRFNCNVWLVNTGWTGGSFGVGTRMKLKDTRRLVDEAIRSGFKKQGFTKDDGFGLEIPQSCSGVTEGVLNPIDTWADKKKFKATVKKVREAFQENCKKLGINDI